MWGERLPEMRQGPFWLRRIRGHNVKPMTQSAVGAHIINSTSGSTLNVNYRAEGIKEVDFVLLKEKSPTALEVKSGRRREAFSILEEFREMFRPERMSFVGERDRPRNVSP